MFEGREPLMMICSDPECNYHCRLSVDFCNWCGSAM